MGTYTTGLHPVAGGSYAWLQASGGWGLSNAGLVVGDGGAVLVDTLFDLAHTGRMLAGLADLTAATPITTAVITHGNGDHWFGNELLPPDARIVAAEATAADMRAVGPAEVAALTRFPGPAGAFTGDVFAAFDFDPIRPRYADDTYTDEYELEVDGLELLLIDVGPAHTAGDTVVFCERDGVVFTGDIVFAGGTPIMWQGPVDNWLRACARIRALGATHLVPGHGPVSPVERVQDMADYLEFVREQAAPRFSRGMDAATAARDIDLGRFAGWPEAERLAANVSTVYRELDPDPAPPLSGPAMFGCMAELRARLGHRRRGGPGMRWVRYRPADRPNAQPRVGVVVDDAVHGDADGVTMLALVAAARLDERGEQLRTAPDEVHPLAEVVLAAPIETPPSLRDFMAFEQHVEGMAHLVGATPPVPEIWYRQPLYYFSNPACLLGPNDDVAMPPGCTVFDFELEIAALVGPRPDGGPLADLSVDQAAGAIVGYLLMNDWTARDLQAAEMQGPLGPCKGKDFATSLGPWLLTADELPGLAHGADSGISLEVAVDGVVFGRDRLASMAWTFAELVAYASRGTVLQSGDVIGSGTCGDGCLAERWGRQGRDAIAPLAPGSTVTLSAGPLGRQHSRVQAAGPVRAPLRDRRAPRS